MPVDLGEYLRDALAASHWDVDDLLVASFTLGGALDPQRLTALVDGTLRPTPAEFDRLVHALNERMAELGGDHPLRYAESFPGEFAR
jgi:hypothetical protein